MDYSCLALETLSASVHHYCPNVRLVIFVEGDHPVERRVHPSPRFHVVKTSDDDLEL